MMQDWFRNAKLGIFIHYGIYAVGDVSESWSFHNGNISYVKALRRRSLMQKNGRSCFKKQVRSTWL